MKPHQCRQENLERFMDMFCLARILMIIKVYQRRVPILEIVGLAETWCGVITFNPLPHNAVF